MMRAWKNRVGSFISSIISWLPSVNPTGEVVVGGPPSPGEIISFTVGISRNVAMDSLIYRTIRVPVSIQQSVGFEVEQ